MPLVEEIASKAAKATHGWAYVPDTGYDPSKAPIVPLGTKRHASGAATKAIASAAAVANPTGGPSSSNAPITLAVIHDPNATARQNTQLARRLAELDRDNARDAAATITGKGGAAGRGAKGKTPATRKILAAQKTFVNYLADEEALAAQTGTAAAAAVAALARQKVDPEKHRAAQVKVVPPAGPVGAGPSLPPPPQPVATVPGPGAVDDSRLVQVVVPRAPSETLMDALTGAPPLSYTAARAVDDGTGKPRRHFCEWCGYWGTIKCKVCGARTCGKECYQLHTKERCQGL